MKALKMLPVVLAAAASVGSALALPTMVVSDNGGGLDTILHFSPSGVVSYVSGDAFWTIVIITGTSYPPAIGQGTSTSPVMDLSVTATANQNTIGHGLTVFFGSDGFGPSGGTATATLTGHITSGPGQVVTYDTYYNAGDLLPGPNPNQIPAGSILLTTSGALPGPVYISSLTDPLNLPAAYALEQVVSIAGGAVASSYSLDSGLQVIPESNTSALMLLGAVVVGLASLRKKIA